MKVSPWVIAVAAVAFAIVAGQFGRLQYRRAVAFEEQARLALARDARAQVRVDSLGVKVRFLESELRSRHAKTDTLRQRIVVVDSIFPPDTSCTPNIAVRDSVIASQSGEIATLTGINEAQAGQITLLQASRDELRKALANRPRYFPRFIGPNVGVGVFVGVVGVRDNGRPALGVGVGITVNVFSVRL